MKGIGGANAMKKDDRKESCFTDLENPDQFISKK